MKYRYKTGKLEIETMDTYIVFRRFYKVDNVFRGHSQSLTIFNDEIDWLIDTLKEMKKTQPEG